MSKLSVDNLKKGIQHCLDGSKEKPRKFLETVELQIGLKDYDTQRDKRFAGTIKLPHVPRLCCLALFSCLFSVFLSCLWLLLLFYLVCFLLCIILFSCFLFLFLVLCGFFFVLLCVS
ncbi:unnamed protein product [Polarella glacialis]|uniref:60S ribosomal protein L10a n=1 Tax=Polarella glacialis TaxID=89957 RepID=A0A813II85_POLGL|nr:unnamed protein product [Polarella glacialis]